MPKRTKTKSKSKSKKGGAGKGAPDVKQLRALLAETKKSLEDVEASKSKALKELKSKSKDEKAQLSRDYEQLIQRQRDIINKEGDMFEGALEDGKGIVEGVRGENKKLRGSKAKIAKQIKDTKESNMKLEAASEEVAGHFQTLNEFAKKLQADHNKLKKNNDQCRDVYLPKIKRELRERQQYIDVETRTKELFRDCVLKIAGSVKKSKSPKELQKQVSLIRQEVEVAHAS